MSLSDQEWPVVELGDHVDLLTGFPFKSKKFTVQPTDIPLLRGDNVAQGFLRWENAKRWDSTQYDEFEKFHLREGDVVLAMDRPWISAGLKYGWITKRDLPALLVQRVARIRGVNGLDTDYLRYVVGSPAFTDHVLSIITGVNVPHIAGRDIKAFKFQLPPLHTQQRIAAILSAYDDLIENNTRRIAILEEMARRLYDEWFLHFRFPGHEAAEFIEFEGQRQPCDWKQREVKEIVKRLKNGTVYKQADVTSSGSTMVIDQSRAEFLGFHDHPPDHEASSAHPIIIFGDHTCKMQIVTIPFSLGPNTIAFTSTDGKALYYLYGLVQGTVETREYKRHWTELSKKKILVANADVAGRYGDAVRPMFAMMETLREQNRNLRAQRDLLLPKLVSGEIDVSAAEAELEAAE